MVLNRGSAEPKGSKSACSGSTGGQNKCKVMAEIIDKHCIVISVFVATWVYFWFRLQLQCYTHTPVSTRIFLCITKYRKMMFVSIWNRTNPIVTAWGSTSNLRLEKVKVQQKRLENTAVDDWETNSWTFPPVELQFSRSFTWTVYGFLGFCRIRNSVHIYRFTSWNNLYSSCYVG